MFEVPNRFRTRAVVESDHLPDVDYVGGTFGIVAPGLIARAVFGDYLDFGLLFAYCFRRFGHPNTGWNKNKTIASYLVTTPFDGLFLSIEIVPFDDPALLFGYRMPEELEKKLYKEDRKIQVAWDSKFKAWRVLQGISLPSDKPGYNKRDEEKEYRQLIAAVDKYVSMGGPRPSDSPSNSTIYAVKSAIKAALEDLNTLVGVDDVLFCASVPRVEWPLENRDDPSIVPKHHSAGYYVPTEYLEDMERFSALHEKLNELGGGSLAKGLAEFTQMPGLKNKFKH